jgi:hypothetical protein
MNTAADYGDKALYAYHSDTEWPIQAVSDRPPEIPLPKFCDEDWVLDFSGG